jgi:hypothetical protein
MPLTPPNTPPRTAGKRRHEDNAAASTTVPETQNIDPVTGEVSPKKRPKKAERPFVTRGDFVIASSLRTLQSIPPHRVSSSAVNSSATATYQPMSSAQIGNSAVSSTSPIYAGNTTAVPATQLDEDNHQRSPDYSLSDEIPNQPILAPQQAIPQPNNGDAASSTSIIQRPVSLAANSNNAVSSSLPAAATTYVVEQQLSSKGYRFVGNVEFDSNTARWIAKDTSHSPFSTKIAVKVKSLNNTHPFQFLGADDYPPRGSKIIKYLCEKGGLLYGINLTEINGNFKSIALTNIKNKMVDWFQHSKEIKERIAGSMEFIYVIDCNNCTLSQEEILIAIGEALCHKAMKAKGAVADVITEDDIKIHCADMPRFHFLKNNQLSLLHNPLTAFARFRHNNPAKQRTLDQFRRSASTSQTVSATTADTSLKKSSTTVATTSNITTADNSLRRSSSAIVSTSSTTTATTSRTTASTTTLSRSSSTKTLLEHFAPQTNIQIEENKMKTFEEKYKKHFNLLINADFWKGWQNNSDVYNSNPDIIPFTIIDLKDMRESFIQLKTEIEKSNISVSDCKMSLLEKCEGIISELNHMESKLHEIQSTYTQQKNEIFALLRIEPNSTLANFLLHKYRGDSNSNQHQSDNSFIDWINSLTEKQLLEKIMEAKQETVRNETAFDANFLMAHLHSVIPQQAATVLVAV